MRRRSFLQYLGAATLAPLSLPAAAIHLRRIPSSGEQLPAIGMGSWLTFDVGDDEELRQARLEVLRAFFAAGGRLIDSSPMYGSSEEVLGWCLQRIPATVPRFAASKVWTLGQRPGMEQMAASERLWKLKRFDLMQVHNLLDWQSHLRTLRQWKEQGRIRYIGITTSHGRRHTELEQLLKTESLDFVQLTCNVLDREAERRLLPLAADRGVAVIINRPFQGGDLFDAPGRTPLPGWAGEIGCTGHAQFFLKYILSHPAVTCVIPATTRVDHMRQNMSALDGPLPDSKMRRRMQAWADAV